MAISFKWVVPICLLIGWTTACNHSAEQGVDQQKIERPDDAWVIRSVLDQNPRMISIALNDCLWVAYSTENAALYKAWVGGINFDGPVYTSAHGPQPTSRGITYLQEEKRNPWRIRVNGKESIPEVEYKGHTIQNNQITLNYNLVSQGQRIQVEESPEFIPEEGKKVGFQRVFKTLGVPEGAQLVLQLQMSSLPAENAYHTNGKLKVTDKKSETVNGLQFHSLAGDLLLKNNSDTKLTLEFVPKPAPETSPASQLSEKEAVAVLMARSDCNACHNEGVKTVGPAYKAVADRYENSRANKEMLINKVLEGGSGNWGEVPMTPHPNLSGEDAEAMVSYILSLDAQQEAEAEAKKLMPAPEYEIITQQLNPAKAKEGGEAQGVALNVYKFAEEINGFPEISHEMLPVFSGYTNALHATENDLRELGENYVIHANGFITMDKETNVVFRLVSDDGSRLYIDDKLVIDNGGTHGLVPKDGEIILQPGKHPFKVEYFQGRGGSGISLQWQPYGADAFKVVPPEVLSYNKSLVKETQEGLVKVESSEIAGDAAPLQAVHPSFTLAQARPDDFQPKVGGMDFLSDGRMVISTWDSLGSVYILEGVQGNDPGKIKVKRIAFGLAEPLGLQVVDDEIYVLQKQELTKLVDLNNDEVTDQYLTVCNGWRVSANFHEFAFGLVFKEGYFYGTLATAINPGGASTQPQVPDRGKVLKINKDDGSFSLIASGLRTPNGIGFGVDNEIYIADNQGDWLPSSKILHLQDEAWYGSRSVDFAGTEGLTETQPVVWLPQDEIGNSPSQPARLNVGPYQNQMVHGEVTHGGIKRVFAEKVNGQYQGAVFRFTQGLEAGVNRLVWGPDSALYIGGIGSTGNWQHYGKLGYGLQKLIYNGKITFEMLAVRAMHNGIEMEFTEPLSEGAGNNAADYTIKQWYYKPTKEYGGPKLDEKSLDIRKISVSQDRRKVFLELKGMKPKHVIYVRLNRDNFKSSKENQLWTTESWYHMNNIPSAPKATTQR